mmetsp:Transcript_39307/g.112188  ORF Transcript_39307/g.112188 Transcript_39307/m.112188 type:complete len:368 (-) Transcript_39307:155-1258(-)
MTKLDTSCLSHKARSSCLHSSHRHNCCSKAVTRGTLPSRACSSKSCSSKAERLRASAPSARRHRARAAWISASSRGSPLSGGLSLASAPRSVSGKLSGATHSSSLFCRPEGHRRAAGRGMRPGRGASLATRWSAWAWAPSIPRMARACSPAFLLQGACPACQQRQDRMRPKTASGSVEILGQSTVSRSLATAVQPILSACSTSLAGSTSPTMATRRPQSFGHSCRTSRTQFPWNLGDHRTLLATLNSVLPAKRSARRPQRSAASAGHSSAAASRHLRVSEPARSCLRTASEPDCQSCSSGATTRWSRGVAFSRGDTCCSLQTASMAWSLCQDRGRSMDSRKACAKPLLHRSYNLCRSMHEKRAGHSV